MEKKGELILTDREHLVVQAVECVDEFDEKKILLRTYLGELEICGSGLSVVALDLENSKVEVEGKINMLKYQDILGDKAKKKSRNVFAKMLK